MTTDQRHMINNQQMTDQPKSSNDQLHMRYTMSDSVLRQSMTRNQHHMTRIHQHRQDLMTRSTSLLHMRYIRSGSRPQQQMTTDQRHMINNRQMTDHPKSSNDQLNMQYKP